MIVIPRNEVRSEDKWDWLFFTLGDRTEKYVAVDDDGVPHYVGTEADCKAYVLDIDNSNIRGM